MRAHEAQLCAQPDRRGHVTFKPNHLGPRPVSTALGCNTVTFEHILSADDPVPLVASLLSGPQPAAWQTEYLKLEDLLYFYARIYGGGLSHAIAAAPDGAIPETLRLIKRYGTDATKAWAASLEQYFSNGLLFATTSVRQAWEAGYNEAPQAEFEALYEESHKIEMELGRAVCQYVREHPAAFRVTE